MLADGIFSLLLLLLAELSCFTWNDILVGEPSRLKGCQRSSLISVLLWGGWAAAELLHIRFSIGLLQLCYQFTLALCAFPVNKHTPWWCQWLQEWTWQINCFCTTCSRQCTIAGVLCWIVGLGNIDSKALRLGYWCQKQPDPSTTLTGRVLIMGPDPLSLAAAGEAMAGKQPPRLRH